MWLNCHKLESIALMQGPKVCKQNLTNIIPPLSISNVVPDWVCNKNAAFCSYITRIPRCATSSQASQWFFFSPHKLRKSSLLKGVSPFVSQVWALGVCQTGWSGPRGKPAEETQLPGQLRRTSVQVRAGPDGPPYHICVYTGMAVTCFKGLCRKVMMIGRHKTINEKFPILHFIFTLLKNKSIKDVKL